MQAFQASDCQTIIPLTTSNWFYSTFRGTAKRRLDRSTRPAMDRLKAQGLLVADSPRLGRHDITKVSYKASLSPLLQPDGRIGSPVMNLLTRCASRLLPPPASGYCRRAMRSRAALATRSLRSEGVLLSASSSFKVRRAASTASPLRPLASSISARLSARFDDDGYTD